MYYSDFYSTDDEVNNFIEQVKIDYPDNNLIDGRCDHEYFIRHVILDYDASDKNGFETLCRMMRAYNSYSNRR